MYVDDRLGRRSRARSGLDQLDFAEDLLAVVAAAVAVVVARAVVHVLDHGRGADRRIMPAGQRSQAPSPAPLNVPGSHAKHSALAPALDSPGPHDVHEASPAALKVPFAHASHVVAPVPRSRVPPAGAPARAPQSARAQTPPTRGLLII